MPPGQPDLSRLSLLIKPASADCNLRCEYCFYLPKHLLYPHTKRHVMPPEVLRRMIGEFLAMAGPNPCFGWQGGEPTTLGLDFFRRAVALQAHLGRPGQAIGNALQTNGLLIDEEWARFLGRYRFLVGLSLDGPQEVHDHYRRDGRGRGTFTQVMRAVEILQRHQVEFNILCMVTDLSASRADELWDFFAAHDLRFLQFIPCLERDPVTGQLQSYSVRPRAYGEFLCRIFDRWAAEPFGRTYVRDMNDLLMFIVKGEIPTCIFRPTCGEYVLIEHNGDVYPCDFYVEPQWRLGNLMETSLAQIATSGKFQEFREGKSNLGPECRGCQWVGQCYGGCQRHRDQPGRPSILCEAYRMLFEHAQKRLEELGKRERTGAFQ